MGAGWTTRVWQAGLAFAAAVLAQPAHGAARSLTLDDVFELTRIDRAILSPDGSRLAMLSTGAQGDEPRGGDNVRLYVWTRATGAVTRLSDAALMTQTMGVRRCTGSTCTAARTVAREHPRYLRRDRPLVRPLSGPLDSNSIELAHAVPRGMTQADRVRV